MDPLASILIPAFNAEASLEAAVMSALAQTWPRKEIIIVDDGSTDGTLALARQFACANVSVSAQPNQGASAARNKALSISQGDFIQWLDSDDILAPDKISLQIEASRACSSKRPIFSSSWGVFFCRLSKAQFCPSALWGDLLPIEWFLRKLEDGAFMQTSTWLVSRELTEAAGPWDTRLSLDDDGEYFCRVLLASDIVRFVPAARVFYRQTGSSSLSHAGRSNKKLDSQFLSIQKHIQHVSSLENSERVRRACLKYLQRWLIYFFPERPDIVGQMEEIASAMGGTLQPPQLPWKYRWLQRTLGWEAAKITQLSYNNVKFSMVRSWDKMMAAIETLHLEHHA